MLFKLFVELPFILFSKALTKSARVPAWAAQFVIDGEDEEDGPDENDTQHDDDDDDDDAQPLVAEDRPVLRRPSSANLGDVVWRFKYDDMAKAAYKLNPEVPKIKEYCDKMEANGVEMIAVWQDGIRWTVPALTPAKFGIATVSAVGSKRKKVTPNLVWTSDDEHVLVKMCHSREKDSEHERNRILKLLKCFVAILYFQLV